jgi:beta-glucosidase
LTNKRRVKGFGKTNLLQPGESQTITLEINAKDLASFVPTKNAWIAEAGNYKVAIGSSSSILKSSIFISKYQNSRKNKSFTPDLKFTDLKH